MKRRDYVTTMAGALTVMAAGCTGSGGGNGNTTTSGGSTTTQGSGTTTTAQQQTIVIGSDIPYKPFEYRTNDGKLTGFDVDMGKAIFGEHLDRTPEFHNTSFDTIIPSLNNGNFRCIMSAMTITDKRAQKVDFTDPYFTAYQTIVVLKNSDIKSKSDLKGLNVGVQKGTTGEEAANKLKSEFGGDMTIKAYDKIPSAFNALIGGQVKAVINDNTVNAAFVNTHKDQVRFVEGNGAAAKEGENAPPYLTLTVEHYGIAFRKGDELVSKVNKVLKTMQSGDEYSKIYDKYFQG